MTTRGVLRHAIDSRHDSRSTTTRGQLTTCNKMWRVNTTHPNRVDYQPAAVPSNSDALSHAQLVSGYHFSRKVTAFPLQTPLPPSMSLMGAGPSISGGCLTDMRLFWVGFPFPGRAVRFRLGGIAMPDNVKCPFCGFPLEKVYQSHTELRYVCSACGKQTTHVVDVQVAPAVEVEDAGGDAV
jgi:hypothetical protein